MPYAFQELDDTTRRSMLREFEKEELSGNGYRSAVLSERGRSSFSALMRDAIEHGDEATLQDALSAPGYWLDVDARGAKVTPDKVAGRLARTEFNTWYVRGFSSRLLDEGVEYAEVYRADTAVEPRAECREHEGRQFPVADLYNGHRARYWPTGADPAAFSIPVGPNCHHTIRRV